MFGVSRNKESCHKFFSFAPGNKCPLSEDRKLELRLGPPGGEEEFWSIKEREEKTGNQHRDETLVSSSYFSQMASAHNTMNDTNNLNSSQKFSVGSALKTSTLNGSQKR